MPISGPPFAREKDRYYEATSLAHELPDNLDVWSFLTSYEHEHRPRKEGATWLVDPLDGREYTYEDVKDRVESLARAFQAELDLKEDDAVGLFSPNAIYFPIATWAAFRCGAIITPANASYSAPELAHQLKLVKSEYPLKALVVHPASLAVGLEAAQSVGLPREKVFLITGKGEGLVSLEDLARKHQGAREVKPRKMAAGEAKKKLAFLSCSSGTTGLPKAIAISHYNVTSNILQGHEHYRGLFKPREDRVLGVLPCSHIYGLVVVLHISLYATMPLVLFPKFEFKPVLDAIVKQRITVLYLVPPMILLFAKQAVLDQYDFSHVRMCMVGAAPLGEDLFAAFKKRFPKISFGQGYGMTETCTLVTMPPYTLGDNIPGGSAGILVPHLRVKVVDPSTGERLGYGQRGELCTSSPSNALYYLGNKKATEETFRDGFVHTGDEAYIDEQGCIYITDRIKELIKVKGLQVAPAELEDCIVGHPDVADCAVVGIQDDYAGELPRAYVVLTEAAAKRVKREAAEGDEVKRSVAELVKKHKSRSKWLEGGVEFVDEIPKNPSGKLLRRVLRDKARLEGKKAKM